jgi:2-methylcitrate dehydratase PrpD
MFTRTENITTELVDFALNLRYESIPVEVIQRTKDLFLDFLSVALGGLRVADSSEAIIAGVKSLVGNATGPSTVIGTGYQFPSHYAALINATMAHSMDFDDTHRASVLHPGTPLFATLLALAEEHEVSGKEFLTAAVAGYDIVNKIGKAHGGAVHDRGFHPTATTGIFACSAAGARLIGLDRIQTGNALGLNVSQSAGSLQFMANGSWNKRFHTGLAAHNAIVSLRMAQNGYLGAVEPIEGEFGYFRLYAGTESDLSEATKGLGTEFEIMNTAVKPYPSCRYTHATIDAVIAIMAESDAEAKNIDAIEIEVGTTGLRMVAHPPELKRNPKNVVEGQFSVFFAAAASVVSGRYNWASYELLNTPEITDLMNRITINYNSDLGSSLESCVTIKFAGGNSQVRRVVFPKGEPENPLSPEEMQGKFSEWGYPTLGPERALSVAGLVQQLDDLDTIDVLANQLRL